MKRLFHGGIHPSDGKELTSDKIPVPFQTPEKVIIPLRQYIGRECSPLVNVGDHVKCGQKIGDGEGLLVPTHSSVSGIVEGFTDIAQPNGGSVRAVILRTLEDGACEKLPAHGDYAGLSREELVKIIHDAGIAGMGGATFPTDVKIGPSGDDIDTVILNACECEPYITADDMLIRTRKEAVREGARILMQIFKCRVVAAIEDNKPESAQILRELTVGDGYEIRVLPVRYPQGAEKQLIRAVTGREVPPGKLPKDVNCAVFNISTTAAIADAVCEGLPLIRRIVSVTGPAIANPGNFIVPIGTPVTELIEACGGLKTPGAKVMVGGPMMGYEITGMEYVVTKGTNCVLCLTEKVPDQQSECIRCGRCVDACPMYLEPLSISRYADKKNVSSLERLNVMDCIECGCCAYQCPAKIPLVKNIRAAKGIVREAKNNAK